MFGKTTPSTTGQDRAQKVMRVLDPAFANRQWSVLDIGAHGRMRDVQRAYEQIKVTEALLAEQQETNRLLRALGQDFRGPREP